MEAAFLGLSRPRPGRERQPGPADAGEDELIAELTAMGGTQAEVFLDAELRELVLPAIRADYRLLERYDVIPVAPHAGPWRSHVPGWCGPPVPAGPTREVACGPRCHRGRLVRTAASAVPTRRRDSGRVMSLCAEATGRMSRRPVTCDARRRTLPVVESEPR
ncbi:thioesterase domain-containing protein [Actinacidiphila glaucinigra]|uniref:thioesterase domain-containing protein n=1 Tax=Actinacidiphila glaucinigra TaxID=235986 RepID=UPI0036F07CF9